MPIIDLKVFRFILEFKNKLKFSREVLDSSFSKYKEINCEKGFIHKDDFSELLEKIGFPDGQREEIFSLVLRKFFSR